ncbi:MAG: CDP-alcohol phosphatidyltransferase family protein [Actinomycetes bacterium]
MAELEPPSDRILTVPNVLSFARLLGVPVFLWLVLVPQADIWAFVVLALAGVSDWLDGYLARALNQRSNLGILLDPLADRLYIAATLLGLALRGLIPWWLVGILVARELFLLALVPILRKSGRTTLPVTYVGKTATFCLFWGFPLFLLSGIDSWVGEVAQAAGWAFALWGTVLYWWAGIRYAQKAWQLRAQV